jgi:hypothetical protein
MQHTCIQVHLRSAHVGGLADAELGEHVIRRRHTVKAKRELPGLVTEIVQPLQQQGCRDGPIEGSRPRVSHQARKSGTGMSNGDLNWITNFIWGIADDALRDLYVRGKSPRTRAEANRRRG